MVMPFRYALGLILSMFLGNSWVLLPSTHTVNVVGRAGKIRGTNLARSTTQTIRVRIDTSSTRERAIPTRMPTEESLDTTPLLHILKAPGRAIFRDDFRHIQASAATQRLPAGTGVGLTSAKNHRT